MNDREEYEQKVRAAFKFQHVLYQRAITSKTQVYKCDTLMGWAYSVPDQDLSLYRVPDSDPPLSRPVFKVCHLDYPLVDVDDHPFCRAGYAPEIDAIFYYPYA